MRWFVFFYLCILVAVCEKVQNENHETTTFRYPTATWSAANFHGKRKNLDPETQKLYLFKPSPFLKPPFTDGVVGAAITKIEDGVNVSGRRRGKSRWKEYQLKKKNRDPKAAERRNFITEPTEPPKDPKFIDRFLEDSLMKYLKSANLTDEYGTLSVEAFSEALKKVVSEKKKTTTPIPPYSENMELRQKFTEELLGKKRVESTTGGPESLLEKLYQRRLQKTWEIINENISVPSRAAVLEEKTDWVTTEKATLQTESSNPTPALQTGINLQETTIVATTSSAFPDWYVTESPFTAAPTEVTTEDIPTTFRPYYTPTKKSKIRRGKKKFKDIAQDRNWVEEELKLSVAESSYYGPRKNADYSQAAEPEYGSIPGVPDRDYPMLSSPPSTGFKCPALNGDGPRMMADPATRCQVFYICTNDGPPAPMLCPNGTLFNENVLVCDWWYNVSC